MSGFCFSPFCSKNSMSPFLSCSAIPVTTPRTPTPSQPPALATECGSFCVYAHTSMIRFRSRSTHAPVHADTEAGGFCHFFTKGGSCHTRFSASRFSLLTAPPTPSLMLTSSFYWLYTSPWCMSLCIQLPSWLTGAHYVLRVCSHGHHSNNAATGVPAWFSRLRVQPLIWLKS